MFTIANPSIFPLRNVSVNCKAGDKWVPSGSWGKQPKAGMVLWMLSMDQAPSLWLSIPFGFFHPCCCLKCCNSSFSSSLPSIRGIKEGRGWYLRKKSSFPGNSQTITHVSLAKTVPCGLSDNGGEGWKCFGWSEPISGVLSVKENSCGGGGGPSRVFPVFFLFYLLWH